RSNFRVRAAEQLRKRDAFLLGLDVPKSVFERRLGHFVPTNGLQEFENVCRGGYRFSKSERCHELAKDNPGDIGRFGVVKRAFARGDFPPSTDTVAARLDKEDAPIPGSAEAGLERIAQANAYFAEYDFFNLHMARANSSHSLLRFRSR